MKKYAFTMGLMCVALSITSCSKDNVEGPTGPKGQQIELIASPETRTAADGMNTKWVAGDAMNVFHAPAGTTTYSSNDQFTIAAEDLAEGRFTGTIADVDFSRETAYDWYAIYPYTKYILTPANTSAGYTVVGNKIDGVQTQTGISNQNHICGTNIPLYGKVANVIGTPTLQMKHLTTLFKVVVTNTGTEALDVTNIRFTTTTENLVGTYFFDITGDTPVFTASSDNTGAIFASKTASLDVNQGTLAGGASGDFYLATKPFTAPAGEVLTLTVTAGDKIYEKSITLPAAKTFVAGKINKLNISIEPKADVPTTWTQVAALADITEGEYMIVNGAYYLPSTATNSSPEALTLESAGIAFVAGSFTGIVPETAIWSFTGTNTAMTIRNAAGNNLYVYADSQGIRVGALSDYTGTKDKTDVWVFETHTDGFAMKANSFNRYCAVYSSGLNWRSYTSKDASGYKENSGILYLYKKAAAPSTDPFIQAQNIDVGAAAVADGSGSYTVGNTTETAVSATCDGTVVTSVVADGGAILYEVSGNYGTVAREGWIELALTNDAAVTKRITVTQAGSTFTVPEAVSIANDATSATFTVVSPDFGWEITAPAGINVSPNTGTAGETEVTVTSQTANTGTETLLLGNLSILRTGDAVANAKPIAVNKLAAGQSAATWHAENWNSLNQAEGTYGSGSVTGDLGDWTYTGCSGFDMSKFNTGKGLSMGKTADNSKITSPTFDNGISGIKFNYYVNDTGRKIVVTIYENDAVAKTETITPTAKNTLLSASIDVTTTGPTYFTFTPGSASRRASVGDIEVKY